MNDWRLRSYRKSFGNNEYGAQCLHSCIWATASIACRQSQSVTIQLLAYVGRLGMIGPTFRELGRGWRPLALQKYASSFLTIFHYCLSMDRVNQCAKLAASKNNIPSDLGASLLFGQTENAAQDSKGDRCRSQIACSAVTSIHSRDKSGCTRQ